MMAHAVNKESWSNITPVSSFSTTIGEEMDLSFLIQDESEKYRILPEPVQDITPFREEWIIVKAKI